ncbi:MAG: hypothetical protein HUK40_07830 [Desulfobacter sp.]|nr:hypothetical protein [Desulfobacter sp.]
MSIKTYLVQTQQVSLSRIKEIEAKVETSSIPLISYLVEEEVVPKPRLQQILFDLFHIPFRSVSDIVFDKTSKEKLSRVIQKAFAAEHKMIPLQISGNTVMVGITDPENLICIKKLDQTFPQYRFTPIFILFSGFTWFYKLLYNENWSLPLSCTPCPSPDRGMDIFIEVRSPEQDKNLIDTLYQEYEKNQTALAVKEIDRGQAFFEFIRINHGKITRRFGCSAVEFLLKKKGAGVLVTARPKKEGR